MGIWSGKKINRKVHKGLRKVRKALRIILSQWAFRVAKNNSRNSWNSWRKKTTPDTAD